MLFRFAVAITVLELVLTLGASLLVTYTEPPPAFVTEAELADLGMLTAAHENKRRIRQTGPCYETQATITTPTATLYVSLWTDATPTDFQFRRAGEEALRDHPKLGEMVLVNEPIPGEEGYAARHKTADSIRFELVRRRGKELLIVRVGREKPYEVPEAAAQARCELRARMVQEHLMAKLRWRE